MNNVSAFIYTVNDFEDNPGELLEISSLFNDKTDDFDDVWSSLEDLDCSPSQKSIKNILDYSKSVSYK